MSIIPIPSKSPLYLSTAAQLNEWAIDTLVVTDIPADSETGKNRAVVLRKFNSDFEKREVVIDTVLYLLDDDGNPINAYIGNNSKNIFPSEVLIIANNKAFVRLSNRLIVTPEQIETEHLVEGVDYLAEYEAYRLYAKTNQIFLFQLIENSIKISSQFN